MNPQIYIHVGFHKSASTWLQRQYFPNTDLNFLYMSARSRRLIEWIESDGEFDSAAFRDAVWAEARATPGFREDRGLILSHEELSGHPHGYTSIDRERTAARLSESFPTARILIVIRNPIDYAVSIYTFRVAVKGFEHRGLKSFVQDEGKRGLYQHLNYKKFLDLYRKEFGAEALTVIPMEWLKSDPDAFRKRLGGFLDGQLAKGGKELDGGINVSTKSPWILGFWRPLNLIFGWLIWVLIRVTNRRDEDYPFEGLRFFYYRVKTQVTRGMNRILGRGRAIRADREVFGEVIREWAMMVEAVEESESLNLRELGYPDGR